ncbi:hypothetical protein FNV43_RR17404 [Rhamnella rubrinervis]|uniref:BHLH domain-containing protein n=1 Tax=Rhamnella rubrinervis TaxID=2594499 RepID=A0A8K0E435_9ROSA|nr:hypothetical protein FNV43_RR17404 [Rhamnella rubrinervis]
MENSQTAIESPPKHPKSNGNWSSTASCTKDHTSTKGSSSSSLINFNYSIPSPGAAITTSEQSYQALDCNLKPPKNEVDYDIENMTLLPPNFISQDNSYETYKCLPKFEQSFSSFGAISRSPIHAQEHVVAERKRREKLTRKFIALSAVLPSLKKMDKASVLEDAIKYVKHLRERVKKLEEEGAKNVGESKIIVKKTRLLIDHDHDLSSSDENSDKLLPEIEARVSGKDILIKIHCEKHKGHLASILRETENLHLTILDTSALQFGNSTLAITIVARMEDEFCMKVKDLVLNLRQALMKLI